ncbi:N-acetylglucosaminyl transferase component-domain-containing protein, partial [Fimicolochytrium jonesii]|uniref:N-acetylglucosaminyl transferase component-domain-containing protein n=1 Tax=Fimicolochytrium jonesii TaxID=1396493 RepID=UPI0022FEC90A
TSLRKSNLVLPAQQIDLRLQQGMFWPQQYLLWRRNPDKLSPLAQARYIGFYNTLWLIANDAIVGVAVGALLLDNAPYLASLMERFIQTYTIDRTRDMIVWLMGSPAGLKLNADLNGILGTLFMELLVLWSGWAQALCPHLPQLIRVISACSVVGVSMSISVFLDLLAIITVHLHLCYIVASKIYYWEVQGLVSMFTLFRGKRKNVEKNRIDSAEYTLDQLLLGTILFALLTFLFPTVAVYYVLFSLIRISVVLTHAVFEIVLAFVNHFPLFAIMLRIKDPRRLPAGIIIDASPLRDAFDLSVWWKSFGSQSEAHATETVKRAGEGAVYMRMKTAPLSYSSIFYQYKYLWTRLRTHYLLTDILNSLFLGRNIQVIPKLQVRLAEKEMSFFCDCFPKSLFMYLVNSCSFSVSHGAFVYLLVSHLAGEEV